MRSRSSIALPLSVLVGGALLLTACTSTKHPARSATSSAPTVPSGAASSAAGSSTAGSSAAASSTTASIASSPASVPNSASSSAAPAPSSSAAAVHPAAIWPTYHHDAARTGNAGTVPAVTALKVAAVSKLDGALYASPLVLRDGKGNLIIAATENNTLYGLRDNAEVVWTRHIGTPVNGSSLPCGNINPSGITGTPVYDPATGLVFAVAFLAANHHELVAVDAETGAVAWTRPVDPPGSHPEVQQERGALLLSNGVVWVPFGGLYGDCGPYHGYLVGVPTSGPSGAAAIYQVPSAREAGIWTPAGAAADSTGHVYASVGNGAQTNPKGPYDTSDSVIELQGTKVVSFFAPASWAAENAADLDLGTTGPVVLPNNQVFVAGKAGNAYLLKQGALGGVGGAVPAIGLCTAFGGAAYVDGTIIVPCTDGVRAVKVSGSTMTPTWHASPPGSPIVGGGVVLTVGDNGVLFALDPGSGAVKAKVTLGNSTTRFATPAMSADGHVYVGTQSGALIVVGTS